jgi:hypothetical protein
MGEEATQSSLISLVIRLFPSVAHPRWGWAEEMFDLFERDVAKLPLSHEQVRACLVRMASEPRKSKAIIKPVEMLDRLRALVPSRLPSVTTWKMPDGQDAAEADREWKRLKAVYDAADPKLLVAAKARVVARLEAMDAGLVNPIRQMPSATRQTLMMRMVSEELGHA